MFHVKPKSGSVKQMAKTILTLEVIRAVLIGALAFFAFVALVG